MKTKKKTTRKPYRPLNEYPRGWTRQQIKELADHYDNQTEDEAVAEAEAAFNDPRQTVMLVPCELVPEIDKLLAAHNARRKRSVATARKMGRRAARKPTHRRAHAA